MNELQRAGMGSGPAEETLRLIAALAAPDGLADRVQMRLRTAPRKTRLFQWPVHLMPSGYAGSQMLRVAAAVLIVCTVVGGSWGMYWHVQPAASAAGAAPVPARLGNSGGFSSAGAMRKPDTLNGPVLTHAVPVRQEDAGSHEALPAESPMGQAQAPRHKAGTHKQPGKAQAIPQR